MAVSDATSKTASGPAVMVVALTERYWQKLVQLTGIGDVINALEKSLSIDLGKERDRYRYRQVLEALIRPWFAERTFEEVTDALERSRVLRGRYRTVENFVIDPGSLLNMGDLMTTIDQPGIGRYPVPGPVLRSSAWRASEPEPAPQIGQDTESILSQVLNIDAAELASLRSSGTIGGRAT